jgi:heme exporter protein A
LHQVQCLRGERELFKSVNANLNAGDILRIEGSNGSGKTSLLRIVAGLSAPASGEIRWHDENITELSEEYFRELLYIGHFAAVKDDLTVLENLLLALELAAEPSTRTDAQAALAEAGLRDRFHLPAKYLSQGQRRRVALARLQLSKRLLWVLDEPFTALDVGAVGWVAKLIAGQLTNNGIVLFTTHQDVVIPGHTPKTLQLGS